MDLLALPNPARKYGEGSIILETPIDDATAAIQTVHRIKDGLNTGKNFHDYAILTRTNKELHVFETACIVNNIPYGRNNASSFLGSPETKAFVGYIELLLGDDNVKKQLAFRDVLNSPLRFFCTQDVLEKSIDETFTKFARKNNISIEGVDPMELLSDSYSCEFLVSSINNHVSGFKVKKDKERLDDLTDHLFMIQNFLKDPNFYTKDLFAEILQLKGVCTEVINGKTIYEDKSFSDILVIQIKKAPGEDDLDDDCSGEELLGNLQFLFELAKPNPVDEEDAKDSPLTPMGFYNKIERYQLKTKELRIDLKEYTKIQNSLPEDERSPLPGVYLGTIHSTKGSEWLDVSLQIPKHTFPYESFPRPGEPEKTPQEILSDLESERRLCYVGMTRARNSLTVICPYILNGKDAGISIFVEEAGLIVGENVIKQ
jgi:superfamily I DNA/RNA helicase